MKSTIKSKASGLLLMSLLTVSILAFAGCQDSSTSPSKDTKKTETTKTETKTETKADDKKTDETAKTDEKKTDEKKTDETAKTDEKKADSKAAGKIEVPSTAKDKQEASAMGNNVTTYKSADALDKACEAQGTLVEKAGWAKSKTMSAPVKTADAWTMVYENGDRMVTLACAKDPSDAKMTMVTMTETANALKM